MGTSRAATPESSTSRDSSASSNRSGSHSSTKSNQSSSDSGKSSGNSRRSSCSNRSRKSNRTSCSPQSKESGNSPRRSRSKEKRSRKGSECMNYKSSDEASDHSDGNAENNLKVNSKVRFPEQSHAKKPDFEIPQNKLNVFDSDSDSSNKSEVQIKKKSKRRVAKKIFSDQSSDDDDLKNINKINTENNDSGEPKENDKESDSGINKKKSKRNKISIIDDTSSDDDDDLKTVNKTNTENHDSGETKEEDKGSDSGINKKKSKRNKISIIDDTSSDDDDAMKKNEDVISSRIKNKREAMTEKFKNRFLKNNNAGNEEGVPETLQKPKIANLYDSESSADEANLEGEGNRVEESPHGFSPRNKSAANQRKTKMIEAQPKQRMSAKMAKEQLQVIKSESGRMLREKQVTLPYHRPRQLSLKDVLARKNISLVPGARTLSLHMNQQQLHHFAKQLEEKEKYMMELCKSESEEEEEEEQDDPVKDDGVEEKDAEKTNTLSCDEAVDVKNDAEVDKSIVKDGGDENKIDAHDFVMQEACRDEGGTCKSAERVGDDEEDNAVEGGVVKDGEDDKISNHESVEEKVESQIDETEVQRDDVQNEIDRIHDELESTECVSKTQLPETLNIHDVLPCSLPNLKPKITGSPGTLIDFESGEVKASPMEMFKMRFLQHTAMKTPMEMEREKERRIQPGASLMKLKRELEDQICERRTQEWTKRQQEEALKKQQEKEANGGNLSDCEELLEKEGYEDECKEQQTAENEEECESSGEEENDVVIKERENNDCDLIDGEAEEDNDDDDDGTSDEVEDNDNESSSESDDEELPQTGLVKKKLTRIIKPVDSDSSDEETEAKSAEKGVEVMEGTPMKKCDSEIFESESDVGKNNESFSMDWEDDLQLGQKTLLPLGTQQIIKRVFPAKAETSSKQKTLGRPDLGALISPLIKPNCSKLLSSDAKSLNKSIESPTSTQLMSSPKMKSACSVEKWTNLQKKLFVETDASQPMEDSQELADLCSGAFPSQAYRQTTSSVSREEKKAPEFMVPLPSQAVPTQMSQNTENELMELCTGKFEAAGETSFTATSTTVPVLNTSDSQNIFLSWSEPQVPESNTQLPDSLPAPDLNEENCDDDRTETETTRASPSKEEPSLVEKIMNSSSKKTITSFFKANGNVNKESESVVEEDKGNVLVAKQRGKYVIVSSSDEEHCHESKNKTKVLKSKKERSERLKRRQLQISDDEQSEEETPDLDMDNDDDDATDDPDKLVEYDSEENEIEVLPQIAAVNHRKDKVSSEFFDHEAEMTSEDEWVGSGDEDEGGLDVLEAEEGDKDQLDQNSVKKQLERIHMKEVMDQDKREIRMLQEILLEDGDLEGGTRERKFRWKNVDNDIEAGAVLGDDDLETAEEQQSEEQWRRQRHERETFLRELMEKENGLESESQFSQSSQSSVKMVTKTSIARTVLSSKAQEENTCENNEVKQGVDKNTKKPTKELPSPIKAPFLLTQTSTLRGSFLSRGPAAMNRLALLARAGPNDGDEPGRLRQPGKTGNFVFATVSPPCNNQALDKEEKLAKRKAASDLGTPLLIKKIRVEEKREVKTRKSLVDYLD